MYKGEGVPIWGYGGALKGPIRVRTTPQKLNIRWSHNILNQYISEINDLLLRLFPRKSEMEPASLSLNNCMQAHHIVNNKVIKL